MKLLVIGGTIFLGRHAVAAAVARGDDVTVFHRGRHPYEGPANVRVVVGDRDGGVHSLPDERWDIVLDTCGYVPRVVSESVTRLSDNTGCYVFVSSVSAYANFAVPGIAEDHPLAELGDPNTEDVTGETYGPLKAECERVVLRSFNERAVIVRPGLIVGPHDPTDRFTYWPVRASRGGPMLVPMPEHRHVQVIDVRDLAAWVVTAAERGLSGAYNAIGPAVPLTMQSLIADCVAQGGSDCRPVWVSERFLLGEGVTPWSDLPLWIPSDDAESAGMDSVSGARAFGAGLRLRPIGDTVADTLAWHRTLPLDRSWRAGLQLERESSLLATWHSEGHQDSAVVGGSR